MRVKHVDTEMCLTMFTSQECPATELCCSRQSWLAQSIAATHDHVTVERFTGTVHMCKDLKVVTDLDDDEELESEKFKTAVRYHLAELVVQESGSVPFNYFGVQLNLRFSVINPNIDTVSHDLRNLRINSDGDTIVTSTPQKQQSSSKEVFSSQQYFRISINTSLIFHQPKTVKCSKPKFVGGLDREMDNILHHAKLELTREDDKRLVTGILLHGPSGTGKTLLCETLSSRLGVSIVKVTGPEIFSKYFGETEKKLREKFEEAQFQSPSILFMDELDSLVPRREGNGTDQERRILAALVSQLDSLHRDNCKVVVIAATSKIDKVEASLRRPGRFDFEVEIGVPNANQRHDILLGIVQDIKHELTNENIENLSRETHGFVGADIEALVSVAVMKAKEDQSPVRFNHFIEARSRVKPSAMREVLIEVPRVSWSDIGGLDTLKLKLRQAVEWPIKHPEVFSRMGISPPKGLLMYGPPGCSKTMIAKALANESGLNFLSIKGPELFSKWVGESERAVREVFRKARQVKPSIVFFDEIDAIGGSRGGGGGGGKVGDRVLAQLLTEMDGVEGLTGVTVVAATNRPDMMDPALLRPGRLDRVVYVPLPDLDTRRKVLEVHTRRIPTSDNVDLEFVADNTEGYSGAEIAAICNEAALAALEQDVNITEVNQKHFEIALNNLKPRISKDLFKIYEKFQSDNQNKSV